MTSATSVSTEGLTLPFSICDTRLGETPIWSAKARMLIRFSCLRVRSASPNEGRSVVVPDPGGTGSSMF